MPYTPGIPTAIQFISTSQPLIAENFTELQTWASVDHSPLASAVGLEGFHYKTTYVPQNPPGFNAVPVFPMDYPGLYSANPANVAGAPLTGFNELFLQLNNAANSLIPLTAASIVNGTIVQSGFFYLPGGLLVKYGVLTMVASNPIGTVFLYPVNANTPVFDAAFAPVSFFTVIGTSAGVPVVAKIINGTVDNLGFTVQAYIANTAAAFGGFNMFYISIGKPV